MDGKIIRKLDYQDGSYTLRFYKVSPANFSNTTQHVDVK